MKPLCRPFWIFTALALAAASPACAANAKPLPLSKVQVTPAQNAKPAAKPKPIVRLTTFELEKTMDYRQLMARWDPDIAAAAKRFGVPQTWIRAVMSIESGGRLMLTQIQPMRSSMGAMGLMQLMPETYAEMSRAYHLGLDPYNPHDNIIAGAAYLRILRDKYGYPRMFEAYNDGPGNLEARMRNNGLLPAETQNYVAHVTSTILTGHAVSGHGAIVKFTRPDGSPVMIDAGAVVSVRAAFSGEYAPGVQSVITAGRLHQGVRETLAQAKSILRKHGGAV
jgi:membrane-bound lytic murein transglycosylase B